MMIKDGDRGQMAGATGSVPGGASSTSKVQDTDKQSARGTRGVDWHNPIIPAGDSPSLPAWPLAVSAALWFVWLGFLLVTAMSG